MPKEGPTKGGRDSQYGVISTHEVYAIDEAKRRLGWSDSAFRAAKRRGLPILTCGKRRYVSGDSLLEFLQKVTAEQRRPGF